MTQLRTTFAITTFAAAVLLVSGLLSADLGSTVAGGITLIISASCWLLYWRP